VWGLQSVRADGCGPELAAALRICCALPFCPAFFIRDVNRRPAAYPRLANHHNRFMITFSCAITGCLALLFDTATVAHSGRRDGP
jgi:hypothetical protein